MARKERNSKRLTKFQRNGHQVVKNFIDPTLCKVIRNYVEYKSKTTGLEFNLEPDFIPNSLTLYGDILTESVLLNLLPKMEELTGTELVPTHSLLRLYQPGDVLPRHKDKLSCQTSVSLCIGYGYDDKEYQWPLYLDGEEILCKPGDALIYHGCEYFHWREAFEGDWQLMVFLFYINKDADFAEDLIYDARPDLGLPKSSQKFSEHEYEKNYLIQTGHISE
jgi:hypothetical protein